MDYELVKFIQATAEYFKYAGEEGFTQIHQFIELVKNNNAVLGSLSKLVWQPAIQLNLGQIIISPNMPENTCAKVTHIGTTNTTEPSWTAVGTTVTDGGVTYLMQAITSETTTTDTAITDKSSKVSTTEWVQRVSEHIQGEMGDYLPLSGGAMTGQTICRNVHNDALIVAGGNQYTADKGALAIFKGADNDGYFYLRANNGITNKYFVGTPQGSLTWDDRELITSGNDQVITGIKNFTNLMCYRVDNNTQGGRVLLMDSKTESPIGIDEFKSNGQVYTRFVDFGAYDGQVRVPFMFNMATGDISTQNGYTHNVAAKSLGSNGYIRYADGLIMQWGRLSGGGGYGYADIAFPITFPSACYVCLNVAVFDSDAFGYTKGVRWWNQSGARIGYENGGATWLAIGA